MNQGLTVAERIRSIVVPVAEEEQLEVLSVEWHRGRGRSHLKIVIDREGGVSLNDCQTISKRLNYILDVEDLPLGSYNLEVSSPGIFSELKRPVDITRNLGKRVEIVVQGEEPGRARLHGILVAFDNDLLTVQEDRGDTRMVKYEQVSTVRLDPLLFPTHQGKRKGKRGKK